MKTLTFDITFILTIWIVLYLTTKHLTP